MSEFYIPPKEISFRLKNKKTEKVLFSREKSPRFGQFSGDTFADQWWYLVPGEGGYQGWYLVKSKFTNNVLFSRTSKMPRVDHTDGNGKWADQWFKIEPGTGDRQNWFRLLNTSSNTVVVSGDGVTNAKADAATDDNQYWSFEFEDMEFVSLDYDINHHKILASTPTVIGSNTATNDTDTAQTITVTLTVTKTITSIFEHSYGITVTGTLGATFGWPQVIEGKLEISVAQTKDFKWGKHTTDTSTNAVAVPVTAKPWSEVTAIATATKSDLELPFTITWKSKKTGYEVKTKGVYKGTSYWNTITKLKQVTRDENRELDPEDASQGWEVVDADSRMEIAAGDEERSLDDEILEGENYEFEGNAQQDEGDTEHTAYGAEEGYAQEEPEREDYEQRAEEERTEEGNEQQSQYGEEGADGTQLEQFGEDGDTTQNNDQNQDDQYNAEPEEEDNFRNQTYTENDGNAPDDFTYNEQSSYDEQAAEEPEGAEQDESVQEDAGYEKNSKYEVSWAEEQGSSGYRAGQDNQEDGADRYGREQASREYGRYHEGESGEFERPTREVGYAEANQRSQWY